ncbi:MAG: hypothetical protein M0Z34_11375 [Nitrospiraceae bacterium]|nr:hypothetical protein [Nitrospiraceae bacterium]
MSAAQHLRPDQLRPLFGVRHEPQARDPAIDQMPGGHPALGVVEWRAPIGAKGRRTLTAVPIDS